MTPEDLKAFEREVADMYENGLIKGPIHLSGGNEEQLIEIFAGVKREDWVFSTWRSHYHALLHGIPSDRVMAEIIACRSMNLNFPEFRFFTSAIVGGILPIALGVAAAKKRKVWAFVGDMTAKTGIFHECFWYARGHGLDLEFVVEDNGLSTNTPTQEVWGNVWEHTHRRTHYYHYKREWPHVGVGRFVQF